MINISARDFPVLAASPPNQLFEAFRKTRLKIAIQKSGNLSQISLYILRELFNLDFSVPKDRKTITLEKNGEIGIIWCRNKSISKLINTGAVDLALLGNDQLQEEDQDQTHVQILESYQDIIRWPLVLAVAHSNIRHLSELKTVATQYPKTARRVLNQLGINPEVLSVEGSAEAYVYLEYGGKMIDAVLDISVTGQTLLNNNLMQWGPPLEYFYPVLLANKNKIDVIQSYIPSMFEGKSR